MAGRTITVAQQKGGAGKTTLVAHLAVAFVRSGLTVAVIDIDPQASLSRWVEARGANPGFSHQHITGWRVPAEVDKARATHDLVLIDSPPHASSDARIAVRAAQLLLVPVQPSPMDLWATQPTLALAAAEKVPARIVLNRVPARSRVADALEVEIAKLGIPVLAERIGNRTGFAAAMLTGRTLVETAPSTKGADEILALAHALRG
jgi:chromosome partitioning protein